MRIMNRLFGGAAGLALFSFVTPAVAQVSQEQPVGGIEDGAGAGDIVVTAQRTESLASKTPIALSAISQKGLREAGITNPTTLSDLVPNLSIDRNGDTIQITIRGVTSTDSTEKGDPSAAFLLDSVYIARPQAQEVSFYDLERVEVLRGPQGTLFGRNTTAGVINVISAKPKDVFAGSVNVAYGAFNTIQAGGMINVPVSSGIALRGAVNYDRRDSYLQKGVASPFSLNPFRDNLSGRLSALIDFSPDISLLVRGDYSRIQGSPTNGVRLFNFFEGPFVTGVRPRYVDLGAGAQRILAYAEDGQSSRDNQTWGVMTEFNWGMGPVVMTYLGGYRELSRRENGSLDYGAPVALRTRQESNYWQNSQELRFAFDDEGPLKAQIGVYYFKEKSKLSSIAIDPPSFFLPPGGTGALSAGFVQNPTTSESKAVFGQVSYNITPRLKLTGGARYSHDSKSRVGATVITFPDPIGTIPIQINDAARKFSKVTWRAGIDYDVNNMLFFATVSTGYKAGGFNDGCEVGSGAGCSMLSGALYYDPETVTSYEAGAKIRLANNAIGINTSIFHYDYNGLQLSSSSNICGVPCQVTTNAGKSKIDGVEFEVTLRPNKNNLIDLGFTYLDARYAQFMAMPNVSFAGSPLDRSPKITASAGYTYTYPLNNGGKIDAGARIRLTDSYMLSDYTMAIQFRQPSFHKTDLTLSYTASDDRFYIQAFLKNLENIITLSGVSAVTATGASFADPRTYGVRAGFKF